MGLNTLLRFLPCFPHFIFVQSNPLQITPLQIISVNNTIPSNVSLTAPSPPPSIKLSIDHDFNKKLLALGMYLTAIQVMGIFGTRDWDSKPLGPKVFRYTAVGPGVWQKGYDVEIVIRNSQKPEDPLQLKTSYITTGLWETMVQVAVYNLYYETVLTLKQHYREIGTLTIKEPTLGATENGTNEDANSLSTPALPRTADLAPTQAIPVNLTTIPSYPAGRVVDPRNPSYTITYTYTGTQINSKDVFMGILGLLADAAQYTLATPLKVLQQVSPSKRCEISLKPLVADPRVNYGNAAHGLRNLIFWIMLPLENFGGMTFVLEFNGLKFAEGSVKAMVPAPGVAADEE